MQFRLRTLMIELAVGPVVLAGRFGRRVTYSRKSPALRVFVTNVSAQAAIMASSALIRSRPVGGRSSTFQSTTVIAALEGFEEERRRAMSLVETRQNRERDLQSIWASDCIRLVRIYQDVIGTPNGQIPIPGISPSRMIEVILKKELPLTPTSRSVSDSVGSR
jgi:hypothetical protein